MGTLPTEFFGIQTSIDSIARRKGDEALSPASMVKKNRLGLATSNQAQFGILTRRKKLKLRPT
jgi:hypothetical protein